MTRSPRWSGLVLLLTMVAYLAISSAVALRWHDQVDPDGLAYMSIAKQTASGELAIRGYWSPLISWLTAGLMTVGINDLIAFRTVTISAGALLVLAAYLIGRHLRLSGSSLACLTLAVGLWAARLSVRISTPDLLGTALVLLYFGALLRLHPAKSPIPQGIVLGALCAVGYFGKYYNLPFFGVHLILAASLMPGWNWGRSLGLTITSFATAAVLILPWAIALSNRYGEITVNTSGAINFALVGPGSDLKHPCWYFELCSLPGDVPFPWEDPHPYYYPAYGWSPFASLDNLRHQAALVLTNAHLWFSGTWLQLGPTIPMSIAASGICALISWKDSQARYLWSLLFLTPLLYASGYFLTWSVDSRYYYPTFAIAGISGIYLLDTLGKRFLPARSWRGTSRFAISAALLSLPLAYLVDTDHFAFLLEGNPPECLRQETNLDPSILSPPTAGLDDSVNYLAYRTGIRTYGVIGDVGSLDQLDRTLKENGISTLVVPRAHPMLETLGLESQYVYKGEFSFCGTDYVALDVSGFVPMN